MNHRQGKKTLVGRAQRSIRKHQTDFLTGGWSSRTRGREEMKKARNVSKVEGKCRVIGPRNPLIPTRATKRKLYQKHITQIAKK